MLNDLFVWLETPIQLYRTDVVLFSIAIGFLFLSEILEKREKK
jgi:hypothetical protein